MKAEDTVMVRPRLQEIWTRAIDVKALAVAPASAAVSCLLAIAKAQAEISFKAGYDKAVDENAEGWCDGHTKGVKEVVEFDNDILSHILQDGGGNWSIESWRLMAFMRKRLDKLREWGLG